MLRCKHVSDALHRQDYTTLPRWKRWGLKIHVFFCLFCGRYQRQVMLMQDTCRCVREEEKEDPPVEASLPESHKSRMKERLKAVLAKGQ